MLKFTSWSSRIFEVIFARMAEEEKDRLKQDPLKRSIATRVKAARLAREWSQEELATRIGKTPESISNIERAKQLPALDTLLDLSRVLDLSTTDMIEASKDGRKLSRERADNEAKLFIVIQGLSDTAVAIAVQQIEALTKVR
jgi:transcriptional regulator with XRE-family HTH domain